MRGEKRMIPCHALEEFFYLDPYGDVYPCNVLNKPIGNLGRQEYAELCANAPEALATVANCPVQCWMVCTAAPAMRRNLWIPARWILRRKLAGNRSGRACAAPDRRTAC
jgi:MoaA/NifB/PqqE/SkfB family radical SAM enzyme